MTPSEESRLRRLYDASSVISVELLGGPVDGYRVKLQSNCIDFVCRLPASPQLIEQVPMTLPGLLPEFDDLYYRWNGHIQDDGTRVFSFIA